jgi:hypothetical protein
MVLALLLSECCHDLQLKAWLLLPACCCSLPSAASLAARKVLLVYSECHGVCFCVVGITKATEVLTQPEHKNPEFRFCRSPQKLSGC